MAGRVTKNGYNQADLVNLLRALRNTVLGKPSAAAGGTLTTGVQNAAFDYMVDGQVKTKASNTGVAFPAGLTNTAAGEKCKLRMEIDSAGAVTYKQGKIDAIGDKYPLRTAARTTVASIDVPASFTFNTTAASGLTFTDGDPDLQPSIHLAGTATVGLES